MRRLAALLAIAVLLSGCSKGPQAGPQPQSEPQSQEAAAPSQPAMPAFAAASPEERLVLESLFKLATGRAVSTAAEADGALDHTPSGFYRLGWLSRAGQAWEGAGLAQGAGGRLSGLSEGFNAPLRDYARRLQFMDFAQAKVLYLDRTAAPERLAALVHVQPLGAFLGMTLIRQDAGYAVTSVVDTQGYTFRRAPEEDLRILGLIRTERWDELRQELLVPYEYLITYSRQDGSPKLVRDFLNQVGQLNVFEGALIAGKESFAFDWVKLPDGSYKAISAQVTQLYDDESRKPVAAETTLRRQLSEEEIRSTATGFVKRWAVGENPEAMVTDLPRFEALSEFSWFGHKQWPWRFSTWSLAAEKARLDGGFYDEQPLPWDEARLQYVTAGPLPRAEFRFGNSRTVLNVYVESPGKVSSVEVSFAGSDEFGNGLHLGVADLIPRLGDFAQGETIMEHAAAGRWTEAAAAARVTPAQLRQMFEKQPAGKVEPGGWPHSERLRLGEAVAYMAGDLSAAMRFVGPDGARRLDRIAFGTRDSRAWLPRDPYMSRDVALRSPAKYGWDDPVPHGNKIALLEPPSEMSQAQPMRFFRGEKGQLTPVAELTPPEPEMIWIGWYRWQHPERAEWWVRYGPPTWDTEKQRVARILWEGEKPEIAATYPAPKIEDGEAYFADIDGDGTPEFLGLSGEAFTGADRPVSLQWLKDGQWQERKFPAGNHWPRPRPDQIGSCFVWKLPDRVFAAPFRAETGPGEPVSYPATASANVDETGGLVWWSDQGRLQWLAPDGPVNAAGDTVVAVGSLTLADTTVLVSSSQPAVLRLYSLKGALLWESPFPLALEKGITVDMNGDRQPDVVAHGRHPAEPKLSRVVALSISPKAPQLVWEGPPLRYQWWVRLAAGDLDGTIRPEIFIMTWSGKGYTGYTVFSDTNPAP